MRFIIPIGIAFLLIIILGGCSDYIRKTKTYKNLQETNSENEKNLQKKVLEIRGLKAKIDTLSQKSDTIKLKEKTSIENKKNSTVLVSEYIGKESLHIKDVEGNSSFKIELKELDFYVYKVENPAQIQLFWKDEKGQVIKNLQNARTQFYKKNKNLIFGMNAGIFKIKNVPEGLYIEEGKELMRLNTKNQYGNFYLKPNGVFFIEKNGTAHIMETEEFRCKRHQFNINYASQSGPMLVINGAIHSVFDKDSNSLYIRNGVGIDKDGQLVFVITDKPVSLYTFAAIFKEHLACEQALYFDGAISQAYIPQLKKYGLSGNFGPLVGIFTDKIVE